jgi:hypothetical protein
MLQVVQYTYILHQYVTSGAVYVLALLLMLWMAQYVPFSLKDILLLYGQLRFDASLKNHVEDVQITDV